MVASEVKWASGHDEKDDGVPKDVTSEELSDPLLCGGTKGEMWEADPHLARSMTRDSGQETCSTL